MLSRTARRGVSAAGLLLALVFAPILSLAATVNVPSEQPTIQAGIDAAGDSGTVYVAPGTYAYSKSIGLVTHVERSSSPMNFPMYALSSL